MPLVLTFFICAAIAFIVMIIADTIRMDSGSGTPVLIGAIFSLFLFMVWPINCAVFYKPEVKSDVPQTYKVFLVGDDIKTPVFVDGTETINATTVLNENFNEGDTIEKRTVKYTSYMGVCKDDDVSYKHIVHNDLIKKTK